MLQAIQQKTTGREAIPIEIKLTEEDQIGILVELYITKYSTGIIPKYWLIPTFIALFKKQNVKECQDHRIISIISHTLKVFLKIIHRRIHRTL